MPVHHRIARSRVGTVEVWNLVDWSEYTHAYEHAVDYVLFPEACGFDFRMPAWPLLPEDLRQACRKERARRMSERSISEETRRKVGESSRQRMLNGLAKRAGAGNAGKTKADEHKRKISQSQKGRTQGKLTCPHCHTVGGHSAMLRWHFNKCRHVR